MKRYSTESIVCLLMVLLACFFLALGYAMGHADDKVNCPLKEHPYAS